MSVSDAVTHEKDVRRVARPDPFAAAAAASTVFPFPVVRSVVCMRKEAVGCS